MDCMSHLQLVTSLLLPIMVTLALRCSHMLPTCHFWCSCLCYVNVPQGDLFDEMKRSMGRMPESQLVTSVLLPMMSALLAMHAAGFIHRDIKPENTLFAANRVLKLAGALGRCFWWWRHWC